MIEGDTTNNFAPKFIGSLDDFIFNLSAEPRFVK